MSPVVLFDGVCNLCNGAIQFILDHERDGTLRFAALQSEVAEKLLADRVGARRAEDIRSGGSGSGSPETIALVDGDRVYTHSDAALRIARHLRAPFSWLIVLAIVPRAIRDAIYRAIARRRYRWFGTSETCRVPTPELRERFLSVTRRKPEASSL